jgi:hypothetical protein
MEACTAACYPQPVLRNVGRNSWDGRVMLRQMEKL